MTNQGWLACLFLFFRWGFGKTRKQANKQKKKEDALTQRYCSTVLYLRGSPVSPVTVQAGRQAGQSHAVKCCNHGCTRAPFPSEFKVREGEKGRTSERDKQRAKVLSNSPPPPPTKADNRSTVGFCGPSPNHPAHLNTTSPRLASPHLPSFLLHHATHFFPPAHPHHTSHPNRHALRALVSLHARRLHQGEFPITSTSPPSAPPTPQSPICG